MKSQSTTLLRLAVIGMGLLVLLICVFVLPQGVIEAGINGFGPIFWGMYATTLPFFIALYHTLLLLRYIDTNQAFSSASSKALRSIKYCALLIGGIYTVGFPYIYFAAKQADAPGIAVIGFVFAFASMTIAVFTAVLERLLQSVIVIKSENDLTI